MSKLAFFLILLLTLSSTSMADDDREEGFFGRLAEFGEHDDDHDEKSYIKPVTDPVYLEECGSCHFAFQAELLPSNSWKTMMGNLEEHFGEDASLEPDAKAQVEKYLYANAGDRSSSKRARKFFRSSQGKNYQRITEIPYFIRKHDEVSPEVIKRPKIQSWANCEACHGTAAKGIYSDDYVRIPK